MRLVFEARHFPTDWKEGMPLPEMEQYATVVKNGDDMRQDQLVLQMFTLMDSLLKDVNLDFKFTLYSCLACSKKDGIMEFVDGADTIQNVLSATNHDVSVHLQKLSDDKAKQNEIMNTYLLSNAGYAVATYLLAIGDRHLENLMLTNTGHMWHLDFGFILGKNPGLKKYYAPIRINKAMILGMGG
jgi:phosphatidylinositol 3-kinase